MRRVCLFASIQSCLEGRLLQSGVLEMRVANNEHRLGKIDVPAVSKPIYSFQP
jgi:hypothetical protein